MTPQRAAELKARLARAAERREIFTRSEPSNLEQIVRDAELLQARTKAYAAGRRAQARRCRCRCW